MDKTYLKSAYILSVYDYKEFENLFLGEFLSGVVIDDETFRFRPFEQIVTSKVISKSAVEDKLEITTHSGSYYVIDADHKLIDISFVELVVMRAGAYSADRVLEMREQLKSWNKSHWITKIRSLTRLLCVIYTVEKFDDNQIFINVYMILIYLFENLHYYWSCVFVREFYV